MVSDRVKSVLSVLYLILFYYISVTHLRFVRMLILDYAFASRDLTILSMGVGYMFIYTPLAIYTSIRLIRKWLSR
jgi:hypothetical protein